nr:hypothetical protein [Tanacetum cinerariifolium]
LGCRVCVGGVVEGSGKSWVVVGRQEKRGGWCYRNGGNLGLGCRVCVGGVVEGSGKSWVVVRRQEKKGEWCYRNGGNLG